MYLFSRQTRIAGPDGLEWAVNIGQRAADISSHPIDLWGTVYSAGFGSVSWTAWFEDMASLESFGDTLNGNEEYQGLAAQGRELTEGGLDDQLMQLLAGEVDPERDPQYVNGVTAVPAGGNIERAMTAGVEIAERASKITGQNTLLLRGMTGPYGGIGWLTGYETIADLQAAQDALAGDASWVKYLDTTGGAFVEDAAMTQSTIYRKLS